MIIVSAPVIKDGFAGIQQEKATADGMNIMRIVVYNNDYNYFKSDRLSVT